jgi:hypothetical protein
MAIDEGLWYLHTTMNRANYGAGSPGYGQPYGYWNDTRGFPTAATGTAVNAFQLAGSHANGDYHGDPYVETVQRALNYILYNTYKFSIGPQEGNNPDTNGNGIGLVAYNGGAQQETYIGGICMIALASSHAPNVLAAVGGDGIYGRKYSEIVQDMVDFFAWGQCDSGSGRGGWRYYHNYGDSDMSTTQWPPLGMLIAESKEAGGMACTVPQFVRDELIHFLTQTQHGNCDNDNGGFGYMYDTQYLNLTKTGAGLICYEFLYLTPGSQALDTLLADPKVQSAVGYIYRHWNDSGGSWDDARLQGNSYSTYAVMKGLSIPAIRRVTEYDCSSGTQTANGFDWFYTPAGQSNKGLATYIVEAQQADGSWDDTIGDNALYDAFSTGWILATLLEHVILQPPVAVICDCDEQEYMPNQDVLLDGSCSYHTSKTAKIVKYEWDFDYAAASGFVADASGAKVTISGGYPLVGLYPIALKVTDDQDVPQTDIAVCDVNVHEPPHCPHAFAHPDSSKPEPRYIGWPGVAVVLDGSASWDPDNEIVAWDWDLDDDGLFGTEDNDCFGEPSDAVGEVTSWTWFAPYEGEVGLRVTDAAGRFGACSDYDYARVKIGNHAPEAVIDGPNRAGAGQNVHLSGLRSFDIDPCDLIAAYAWDLDDDGVIDSDLPETSLTTDPTAPPCSTQVVKLKVMDNHGAWSDFTYHTIIVNCCTNTLQLDTGTGPEPLYIRPHEVALLDMDALDLCQYVFGCQAFLNFSSQYFIAAPSGPGSPQVAAGGGVWDELIYRMWTTQGDLDVAVGVDLNVCLGTIDDGTVAKFGLTSNGTEGITKMVFRPDTPVGEWCHGTSSTFFADANAMPVYPNKIDSQDIIIDGTPPCIKIVSITQNSVDVSNCAATVVQGVVDIVVESSDALAGLVGPPVVTTSCGLPVTFLGEGPVGSVCDRTFRYRITIEACTPNGQCQIQACAEDKAGNSACDGPVRICINSNQISGLVELEGLTPRAGGLNRVVTFVAKKPSGSKAWNITVHFPQGQSQGNYVLTDVPDGITCLSAKTAWNLRRRKTGLSLDPCGQLTVDFLCDNGKLWAGDARWGALLDDNDVNILDYAVLKRCWCDGCSSADWDGDGVISLMDYALLRKNFFKKGDPECN